MVPALAQKGGKQKISKASKSDFTPKVLSEQDRIYFEAYFIEGMRYYLIGQTSAALSFFDKAYSIDQTNGGLNFQIEHHLFPNICHVHYRKISSIVKETAAEFGLPYKSANSFIAALHSHLRLLKQLGMKPKVA